MINRLRLVTILLILVFLSTGCWDVEEVNRRALPNVLFLDIGQTDKVQMGIDLHVPGTLQPPVNTMEQQFEKNHGILYTEGRGLLEAWSKLQTNVSRHVFFGQLRAIIISEQFAKQDLEDSLDFIGRIPFIPSDASMLVTKEDIQSLVDLKNNSNFIPGNYIAQYFQSFYKKSLAKPIYVWEVFARIDNKTADPYFPIISTNQGNYVISGLALFSETRMVGELNQQETYAFSILDGGSIGYFTVPLEDKKHLAFLQMRGKSKIVPRYNGEDNIVFEIEIKAEGMVAEINPYQGQLTLKDKKKFDEAAANYIQQEVEKLLQKLTQLNTDPVGFGEKFRGKYPDLWEKTDWEKVYPNTKFIVKTKFNTRKTGLFR
ncbi:MAG: Ger(x)C family spore germination protein [Bacillota bacterium]